MELYTEAYARIYPENPEKAIAPYVAAAEAARECGLGLNAGHDLSLVNLAYVKGVESDFALVKDDRLEISRRQRTAFLTAVASYMGGVL